MATGPQTWEYAQLTRLSTAAYASFTHRPENNTNWDLVGSGTTHVAFFDIMRQFGDAGWELVAVWTADDWPRYLFKRPL